MPRPPPRRVRRPGSWGDGDGPALPGRSGSVRLVRERRRRSPVAHRAGDNGGSLGGVVEMGVNRGGRALPVSEQLADGGEPDTVHQPLRGAGVAGVVDAQSRKGEEKPKQPGRLERQVNGMDLDEMLDGLPKACDHGAKKNAKGFLEAWRGYKLHIDTGDSGVPLSAILTSASVHDSQVAIPLAMMTAERVTNLYDLMDAAYDAREIHQMSERLGYVPIIDVNPRRDKDLKEEREREARAKRAAGHVDPGSVRFRIRSAVERTNARLKDEFGGRHVRVRGHSKVACHL